MDLVQWPVHLIPQWTVQQIFVRRILKGKSTTLVTEESSPRVLQKEAQFNQPCTIPIAKVGNLSNVVTYEDQAVTTPRKCSMPQVGP